jgi:hypothetical protein
MIGLKGGTSQDRKLDAYVKRAVAHLKSVNGIDVDHFGGFGAQRSRKLFLQQFDLHSSSTAMNALNGALTSHQPRPLQAASENEKNTFLRWNAVPSCWDALPVTCKAK